MQLSNDHSAAKTAKARASSSVRNEASAAAPSIVEEKPADSVLIAAQSLWGIGNLSPLDHLFASTAIVNLVPAMTMGFAGYHLGRRLHRYAEDTDIWIDAFEAEAAVSRMHLKKKTTIKLYDWNKDIARLKKNRYPTFMALQIGMLSPSLQSVYGPAADSLKNDGKLFAADLMWTSAQAPKPNDGKLAVYKSVHSIDEHKRAMAAAGMTIERTWDLTDGLLAAIRSGLLGSLATLTDLRELSEPRKSQRKAAFCSQLETWVSYYVMAQRKEIAALAFLAIKQTGPARPTK